jgi:undecaprenyl-diphosphatase
MVHGGTLLAVFVVLWKDIWAILRRIIQPMTGFLILGTIPAVIAALLGKDLIERAFHSGGYLGFAFLFTALVLFIGEGLSRGYFLRSPIGPAPRRENRTRMYWQDALIIGLFQAAAIIPGVSRSGLTLSGALSRKLDRDLAARFSFLLSIPAILGALVFQLKDLSGGPGMTSGIGLAPMVAGTLTAALVGFFAIKLMLTMVRRASLRPFACYVGVLGLLVLADQYIIHRFFS